jgi:glycosyltransferase involved in cell wall biosynthesis
LRLALNYLSYTFFATIKAFWFGMVHKYDTIIVHETSPVMVGIPAVIIKKMQKISLHFWVLDLWPESLSAAGGINSKCVLKPFERLTKWLYNNSDTILIGSKGYRKSITQKGDYAEKIRYFPNWVETTLISSQKVDVPRLPEGFNVVIAGNMGDAQDIPHVLEAVTYLKNKSINIIFIGNGRKREYVENYVRQNNLQKCVYCLGQFPLSAMPSFFEQADVLFMALKDVPIFSITVPSRLQAYMSAGKPVIAMINGEGADLIKDADCGWSVNAGDSLGLARLLDSVSLMDASSLNEKGLKGIKYSQEYFNFAGCIDKLEEISF